MKGLRDGIGIVKGFTGSYLLRRESGDEVQFITFILQAWSIKSAP
jgi:hypothetical protein